MRRVLPCTKVIQIASGARRVCNADILHAAVHPHEHLLVHFGKLELHGRKGTEERGGSPACVPPRSDEAEGPRRGTQAPSPGLSLRVRLEVLPRLSSRALQDLGSEELRPCVNYLCSGPGRSAAPLTSSDRGRRAAPAGRAQRSGPALERSRECSVLVRRAGGADPSGRRPPPPPRRCATQGDRCATSPGGDGRASSTSGRRTRRSGSGERQRDGEGPPPPERRPPLPCRSAGIDR